MRDPELEFTIQTSERKDAFRAIAARTSGVFIVRVRSNARVDHALVADGKKGVIIDSEELFVLRLSSDSLERCGGRGALKLRVCEVRVVLKSKI